MNSPPAAGSNPPPTGPEPVNQAEKEAFAALVDASLPAVRASAQAWRNGLTALITLVTTSIILKGRDTTADLTTGWRLAITLTIGGGLAAAGWGLWQALAAEAGTRTSPLTLAEIHAEHASVAAYQVALAITAGQRLQAARNTVAVALALLLTGVLLAWWAPTAPATPSAYLEVTYLHQTSCGILQSADGGQLRLTTPGIHNPIVTSLTTITNLAVVPKCP
jgi:hypothetical protein